MLGKLYKTLIGIASAIVAFEIVTIIFLLLNLESKNFEFYFGWLSCMGYYIGTDFYELSVGDSLK